MKKLVSVLLSYFFRGLLFTVPAAVTMYVIVRLFMLIDGLFTETIYHFLSDHYDVVKSYGLIPGLGIVSLFILITLLGVLASSVIALPITRYTNSLLDRVPLVKTIYSAIKDLLSAFVGQEKRFDQPVLVRMSKSAEVEKLGFLTKTDLSALNIKPGKVAVYLPHSYAWSGNLYIVPAENVTPLDSKAADVMKFIMSGAISDVESEDKTNA